MMIRLSGGIVFSTDCQFRHEQKPHTGLHGVIITEPLLEQLSRFRAKEWKIFSWPGQTLAEYNCVCISHVESKNKGKTAFKTEQLLLSEKLMSY